MKKNYFKFNEKNYFKSERTRFRYRFRRSADALLSAFYHRKQNRIGRH